MALQRYPLNRFDTSIGGAGASYFIGDVFADLPTSGLRVGDLGYTVSDGKLWAANSTTTFAEKGAAGAAGPAGPSGSGAYAANDHVRYVNRKDYASDALAGNALLAAYAALPSIGGVIIMWPGVYDLGSQRLTMARDKPVSISGWGGRFLRYPIDISNLPGVVIKSSNQYIFSCTDNSVSNGRGFEFRNLSFQHSGYTTNGGTPATTGIGILLDNINYWVVDNCYYNAGNRASIFVVSISGGNWLHANYAGADSSWGHLADSMVRDGRLFLASPEWGGTYVTANGNNNHHLVEKCIAFGGVAGGGSSGGVGSNPAVFIRAGNRCLVRDNNFEQDWNPAVVFKDCYGCRSEGNSGENGQGAAAQGYYTELDNTNGTYCNDIGASGPAAGTGGMGVLYHLLNSSNRNTLINTYGSGAVTGYNGTVSTSYTAGNSVHKDGSVGANNVFWGPGVVPVVI